MKRTNLPTGRSFSQWRSRQTSEAQVTPPPEPISLSAIRPQGLYSEAAESFHLFKRLHLRAARTGAN